MTKSQLIGVVSEKIKGLTKNQVAFIVDSIFDGMKEALQRKDKIEIRGLGSFRLKTIRGYTARNPRTGQKFQISERNKVHFKVGKPLRDLMNPANPHK